MLGASNITPEKTKVILFEDDDGDAIAVPRAFPKGKIINPLLRLKNGFEPLAFPKVETERESPRNHVTLRSVNIPKVAGIELHLAQRNDSTFRQTVLFALMNSGDERDKSAAYFANAERSIFKLHSKDTFLKLMPAMVNHWKFAECPVIKLRERLNG